jgi:hypothetical protein
VPAPRRRRLGLLDALLALALLLGLLGPRVVDGYAALQWTAYHAASGPGSARPEEHARAAGRWASRALDRAAPLPYASDAARLALGLGRSLEPSRRAAALALYSEVRASLDRARASPWRGIGLARLLAEARELEERARAAQPPPIGSDRASEPGR